MTDPINPSVTPDGNPEPGLVDPRREGNPPVSGVPLSRPTRRTKPGRKSPRTKLDTGDGGGQVGPIGRERGGGRGGQH